MECLTLIDLKDNQQAVIAGISGGRGFARRLEAMGIRAGVKLTKVSKGFMRGPLTIKVHNNLISIGHGMAKKILVIIRD